MALYRDQWRQVWREVGKDLSKQADSAGDVSYDLWELSLWLENVQRLTAHHADRLKAVLGPGVEDWQLVTPASGAWLFLAELTEALEELLASDSGLSKSQTASGAIRQELDSIAAEARRFADGGSP